MAVKRGRTSAIGLVALLALVLVACGFDACAAHAEPAQVGTLRDVFARLKTCWKPPPASQASPNIDITVIVSYNRAGEILGHPKITYESKDASDNDRLIYRIA